MRKWANTDDKTYLDLSVNSLEERNEEQFYTWISNQYRQHRQPDKTREPILGEPNTQSQVERNRDDGRGWCYSTKQPLTDRLPSHSTRCRFARSSVCWGASPFPDDGWLPPPSMSSIGRFGEGLCSETGAEVDRGTDVCPSALLCSPRSTSSSDSALCLAILSSSHNLLISSSCACRSPIA